MLSPPRTRYCHEHTVIPELIFYQPSHRYTNKRSQAPVPNVERASTLSMTKYFAWITVSLPLGSILVRFLYIGIRSSGRILPSAVARAQSSWESLNLTGHKTLANEGDNKLSHDIRRNHLTLCIVIRAVGEEDVMTMDWFLPRNSVSKIPCSVTSETYELFELVSWNLKKKTDLQSGWQVTELHLTYWPSSSVSYPNSGKNSDWKKKK